MHLNLQKKHEGKPCMFFFFSPSWGSENPMGGGLRKPLTPMASLAYGTISKCCSSASNTKNHIFARKKTKSSKRRMQRCPEVCRIRGSPVPLWLHGLFGKEMNSANAEGSSLCLAVSPGAFMPPRRAWELQTPMNTVNICLFRTVYMQSKCKAKSLKCCKLPSRTQILKSCLFLSFTGISGTELR